MYCKLDEIYGPVIFYKIQQKMHKESVKWLVR